MNNIPKNSLKELPEDPRDFNLGAVFPQIKIEEVPFEDFVVAEPIVIKDQGDSDMCSAYALTAVSEDQEEEELLPQFQFYQTKLISGDPDEWGANLRDACRSVTKVGSLPVKGFEYAKGFTREGSVLPKNWNINFNQVAAKHKKETYWEVTGRYDVFDNIRTALWQYKHKKCSILTGCLFRTEWLDSNNGIIPSNYNDDGFGHAFKIFGQKIINNEVYLIAQLSQGSSVGDKGFFYFSREVTNKEIGKYGMYMFKDIPREEAESYLNGSKTLHKYFWDYIISIIKKTYVQIFKNVIWRT